MKIDIQKYVAECDVSQSQKFETIASPGLCQSLHISDKQWSKISMDFITGILTFEGKDVIFVIVDWLTKYAHFIGNSSKAETSQVADSYVKNIFKPHQFPKVSLGIPSLLATFGRNSWDILTTRTSYHPYIGGQIEVVNKCL